MFNTETLENTHYSNTNKLNFTGYPSSPFPREYKYCIGMYVCSIRISIYKDKIISKVSNAFSFRIILWMISWK